MIKPNHNSIEDVHNKIDWNYPGENDLTISMMHRAVDFLSIKDPTLLNVIYESVYFFTDDWPETEGWGSSDTSIMLRSVEKDVNHELKFRAKEAV